MMECKTNHGTFEYQNIDERPTPALISLVEAWFLMTRFQPPFRCTVVSTETVEGVSEESRIVVGGFSPHGQLVSFVEGGIRWKTAISPDYTAEGKEIDAAAGIGIMLGYMINFGSAAHQFNGDLMEEGLEGEMYSRMAGLRTRLLERGFTEKQLTDAVVDELFPSRDAAIACTRCMEQLGLFVSLVPPRNADEEETAARYEWTPAFTKSVIEETSTRHEVLLNLERLSIGDFLDLLTAQERELLKRLVFTEAEDYGSKDLPCVERRLTSSTLGLVPSHLDWFVGHAYAVRIVSRVLETKEGQQSILGHVWRIEWERYKEVLTELCERERVEVQAAEAARLAELAHRPSEDERIEQGIASCRRDIKELPGQIDLIEQRLAKLKQQEQKLWDELRKIEQKQKGALGAIAETRITIEYSRKRLPELEHKRSLRQELAEQEARKILESIAATAQGLNMKPATLIAALERAKKQIKES